MARTYTVVTGDTLSGIATRYGTTVAVLLALNPEFVDDPNLIHPGDVIVIPVGSSVFDVKDFGAVGDGVTDDTAAFQATFDAAITDGAPASVVRTTLGSVVFPPGNYILTAPITILSVRGLNVIGAGPEITTLMPKGTFDTVFDIDGLAYSTIGGFTITSNETHDLDSAIKIEWTTARARRSTTQNEFHHIYIRNLTVRSGITLGVDSSGSQVDQETFYKCTIAGSWSTGEGTYWQYGIESGDGTNANGLAHNFIECIVTYWAKGVAWDGTSGNWFGGAIGHNGADFFLQGAISAVSIDGVRSEGSKKFIDGGGVSGAVRAMSISNVDWHANGLDSPYTFMSWGSSGTLTLTNVTISNSSGNAPRLELSNMKDLAVTLINCASEAAVDAFIYDTAGGPYSALFLGYTHSKGDSGTYPLVTSLYQEGDAAASGIGFFGVTPVSQQTGVAVSAAGIHAALVNLGLITA